MSLVDTVFDHMIVAHAPAVQASVDPHIAARIQSVYADLLVQSPL